MADGLTLEIVEGPGAGRQVELGRPLVVGRAPGADVVLDDGQVSRYHARVSPTDDGSATVEDLGSANGTFVNHNELVGPTRLDPGDELLVGVTLLQLRTADQVRSGYSGVIAVPPALTTAPRTPDYVNPEVIHAEETGGDAGPAPVPQLDRYLDVRVRRRAQLAPLALFVLVAIALILYFALR